MPRHQFITFGKIDPFETTSKSRPSVTNVYQCPDCHYSTPNLSLLRRHIAGSHTRDFPLHCSVCGKGFVLRIQLQQHVLKHHPVKTEEKTEIGSECDICKERFPTLPALKEHKKSEHEKSAASKPRSSVKKTYVYRCPDCHYSTPNTSHLRWHIAKRHTRDFPLYCSVCSKGFFLRVQLQQHVLKHHPVKTEEKTEIDSECDICKELFPSLPALEEHKKSEHRSHCCKWCSFSAENFKTLRDHLQTHSSQLHRCEFCNKAFLQKVHLKIHVRVHTGERPYICTSCGKAFTQRSSLEAHNKKLKKCKFLCQICNENFLRDTDLQKHLRIHAQSSTTSAAPAESDLPR